ncbi:hypothetical protein MBELCI_3077 [Limimaricola cinnabarinus LL-001]|uniref:Uncharacterized protein n=1 Tax=Limimaricola cinnabarinus LL-001 TaxID=1337093 RepID=U2Z6H2_9RHOB|nr:hypothetical protein MBELCI_3077 [Limimaricola cinnabarinus LL-001]
MSGKSGKGARPHRAVATSHRPSRADGPGVFPERHSSAARPFPRSCETVTGPCLSRREGDVSPPAGQGGSPCS